MQPFLTFDQRKRIALHEAAHAVAARAYEMGVASIEIGTATTDSGLGRIKYGGDWTKFEWDNSAWVGIVVALAGPCVDLVFYAPKVIEGAKSNFLIDGARSDFESAHRYARKLDPQNSIAVIHQAWATAQRIVRNNRAAISCLAIVLERSDKLSGAEIDGIIGAISGKARPDLRCWRTTGNEGKF